MTVTGKNLIDLGFPAGAALGAASDHARQGGLTGEALVNGVAQNLPVPQLPLQSAPADALNPAAEDAAETDNFAKMTAMSDDLTRNPTVRGGAVMPDACPAGPVGTIPVGGVLVAEGAIHPGMHSAVLCCSVKLTDLGDADPRAVQDGAHEATHFGPGGRANGKRFSVSPDLQDGKTLQAAVEQMGTQGDGNHFAFVGRSAATGRTCLVMHHGSRGLGAGPKTLALRMAERFRKRLSPVTRQDIPWIPATSTEGIACWVALHLIRHRTKANLNAIHQAVTEATGARMRDRFWNEQNVVLRRGDLFHHAKGATPVAADFLPDRSGGRIMPLNMADPVRLIRGRETDRNLGFAPHGAGRNLSRTAHKRRLGGHSEAEVFVAETAGLGAGKWSGNIDLSELPSAYRPAVTVGAQIARFDPAEVGDKLRPNGGIMAGDRERDAPWRRWAAGVRTNGLAA